MGDEDMDVLLAWRIAMRCRHYLTVQCMDSPSDSARMMLYRYGSDLNF
ncbi:hypothetical protein GQ600_1244 [Phytophthora cactorum]|nr:hypothetical protein GQ600_1244 [Phytophthora cactorum]